MTWVQTSEAERIGVNQVAKVHATGNPTGTDQCELSVTLSSLYTIAVGVSVVVMT